MTIQDSLQDLNKFLMSLELLLPHPKVEACYSLYFSERRYRQECNPPHGHSFSSQS